MAKEKARRVAQAAVAAFMLAGLAGCLNVPDKPITINLNVKIDQEVRVKLDKPVEDLIAKNPDAF